MLKKIKFLLKIPLKILKATKLVLTLSYIYTKRILISLSFIMLWQLYILIAIYAKFFAKRKNDVGLGPLPLINNIYHKNALEKYGYSAKTFVTTVYFITNEFDYRLDKKYKNSIICAIATFAHIVLNYKILYTYFNGTMPYANQAPKFLQNFILKNEPWLYKLSGIKLVVMPYGGDVHDLSKCPNLLMKNSIIKDYPYFQKGWRDSIRISVDSWTKYSDHVISGCDWVWFTYHWDTLLSGHFSIDVKKEQLQPKPITYKKGDLIKIFHAPNHKTIKGSNHFIKAVNELKDEGFNVELVMVQGKPNHEVLEIMSNCHIVADQLIIGWYAMTAIEAMSLGKPVLCYLHQDLLDLYTEQEILIDSDIPIVNCNIKNVKDKIRDLIQKPEKLHEIEEKSRLFVEKYHSLEYIGGVFNEINKKLLSN